MEAGGEIWMLMLRGQGGEVELCPKATHSCYILYLLYVQLSKHALIQTFHGWQLCQKVVKTVRSDGTPSKAIPPLLNVHVYFAKACRCRVAIPQASKLAKAVASDGTPSKQPSSFRHVTSLDGRTYIMYIHATCILTTLYWKSSLKTYLFASRCSALHWKWDGRYHGFSHGNCSCWAPWLLDELRLVEGHDVYQQHHLMPHGRQIAVHLTFRDFNVKQRWVTLATDQRWCLAMAGGIAG